MADSFLSSPGWENFKRSAPVTRGFNHLIAGTHFERVFQRWPLPASDPESTINDVIFGQMISDDWSRLHTRFVDKETAKPAAISLLPSLLVAETVSVIRMEDVRSIDHLYELLEPFVGEGAVAKPTHASGSAVFLDDMTAPSDLRSLYDLALLDYIGIMREMQYRDLPKKVIVEATIPPVDGGALDDYKFHCVRGEPLVCQIDHSRFGKAWSRIFGVPGFEPIDACDGMAQPQDFRFASSERIAEMIAAARILSAPFDFVRVDLYNGRDGIYFGELTFSPAASLGIAPASAGDHRVNGTHRIYSDIMMSSLKTQPARYSA